jgi:NAD(P)-dependent dehydrogenase (short-subunit alcohol dehydrogenase family)
MEKLEGKIAVVMGGNSGGGFVIAQRFVADGAHIFITGVVGKANSMLQSR